MLKTYIIWLLLLHDTTGEHITLAYANKTPCMEDALALNAATGPHRAMEWTCEPQKVLK